MKKFYDGLSIEELKNLVNRYNKKNNTTVIVVSIVGALLFCALVVYVIMKIKEKACCGYCHDDDFEDYCDDEDMCDENGCNFTIDEDFEK